MQQFWYFTAYFAMFWFIPVFNWIVHNLELKKFRYLIYALLTIFGFVPWVSEIFGTTAFGVAEGYTALWLSILYLVGAGIRVYGFSAFSLRKREHSAIGLYYQLWFDCRPWMCDRRRRTYFSGDCDQGRKSDSKSNKN